VFNPDQADAEGDGFGDVCDNCPAGFNPEQDPAVFPHTIHATGKSTFEWSEPEDVVWVRGLLKHGDQLLAALQPALVGATQLTDPAPPDDGGNFYLVSLGGSCQASSWQSSFGAEPARDIILP
jgi:hypothetical protein